MGKASTPNATRRARYGPDGRTPYEAPEARREIIDGMSYILHSTYTKRNNALVIRDKLKKLGWYVETTQEKTYMGDMYWKVWKRRKADEYSYRIKDDNKWYYHYDIFQSKKLLDIKKTEIKTRFNEHYQKKLNSKGKQMDLLKDLVSYGKNISFRSFKIKDNNYRLYCNYEKQFIDRWYK